MSDNYRHSGSQSRGIIRRIVIEGELILQTPVHFGAGDSDGTTLLVLEDALDKKPLLTGSSIAGALRHHLLHRLLGYRVAETSTTLAAQLFGEAHDNNRGTQSRLIIDDAIDSTSEKPLEARNGVKIKGVDRTAEEGALYSFQVWAAGTRFPLRFELCQYEEDKHVDNERYKSALATALAALSAGEIPMGARKHRGYGRGIVKMWRVHEYLLNTVEGLIDWLQTGGNALQDAHHESIFTALNTNPILEDARQFVCMELTCGLEDSLLIRAGSDVVDMAHLMTYDENGQPEPVLSGTTVAGALRARALKVANTLTIHDATSLIDDMFGKHGDNKGDMPRKDLTASRLIVEEHPIKNAVFDRVQNRVRIDRFTGGAFDTGLFGQQPVFGTDATEVIIKLELHYPTTMDENLITKINAQVGLLLLLLKDLWTGDLPLGGESGVGRGRLCGKQVILHFHNLYHNESIVIDGTPRDLTPEQRSILSVYVEELQKRRKGGVS